MLTFVRWRSVGLVHNEQRRLAVHAYQLRSAAQSVLQPVEQDFRICGAGVKGADRFANGLYGLSPAHQAMALAAGRQH
jgi:hypothetical protein